LSVFDTVLRVTYARVPLALRPPLKHVAVKSILRGQALGSRRRVERGERIEFLDLEIAHLEPFEFLGEGAADVLVETRATCVSVGTERAVLCGLPGARRGMPYTPGYSAAGVVSRAGKRSGFKPGDRVAGRMPHASRGVMTKPTLFRVPDNVPDADAAFIEIGIICLQGVRKAAIRPGERVAVVGQGVIGQLALRQARLAGAEPLIAVASSRQRMETAVRGGAADEFVALSDGAAAIDAIAADVVIEAVGSSPAIGLAMRAARPGGRVVLLGSSRDLGRDLDWWHMAQQRDLTLVGAHIGVLPQRDQSAGLWTYEQEGRAFLELLSEGRLNVSDLITWRPKPSECNHVFEMLANGRGNHVGIVFDWGGHDAASRQVG
jgi:2-desacetyl-2-hydroxyethyl bacteriochlorophyllide A dehydrogenase